MQTYLRAHRPLCVVYESARWLKHKICGKPENTPVWYGFDHRPQPTNQEPLPLNAQWYHIARPLYMHEQVYYRLDNALAVHPHVKGFAFVFFMGTTCILPLY